MDALQSQHEQEMKFGKALEDFFDGHIVFKLNGNIYERIATALESEFRRDDLEGWLNWWMWECDFGRNQPLASWDEDDYVLKTAGELYDFLILQVADEDK